MITNSEALCPYLTKEDEEMIRSQKRITMDSGYLRLDSAQDLDHSMPIGDASHDGTGSTDAARSSLG